MKVVKLVFKAVCVSLAIYMTILQSLRLQLNEDFSSIAFRHFNEDSQSQYPTITFCFQKQGVGNFYDNDVLNTSYALDSNQYRFILKGRAEGISSVDINNAMKVNIKEVSIKAAKAFAHGHTVNNKGIQVNKWDSKDHNGNSQAIPMFTKIRPQFQKFSH